MENSFKIISSTASGCGSCHYDRLRHLCTGPAQG